MRVRERVREKCESDGETSGYDWTNARGVEVGVPMLGVLDSAVS